MDCHACCLTAGRMAKCSVPSALMGGGQNYGPFSVPYYNTAPSI